MVKTASTMKPLATKAPDFSLINVDGRSVGLADFEDAKAYLVAFAIRQINHLCFGRLVLEGYLFPRQRDGPAMSRIIGRNDREPDFGAFGAADQLHGFVQRHFYDIHRRLIALSHFDDFDLTILTIVATDGSALNRTTRCT